MTRKATLEGVRGTVAVTERITVVHALVRHMVTAVATKTHARVAQRHVRNRGLTVVVAATKPIDLLALQLVLNPLTVGSVTDQREDRPDAFDEKCTLSGIGIIQSSLKR